MHDAVVSHPPNSLLSSSRKPEHDLSLTTTTTSTSTTLTTTTTTTNTIGNRNNPNNNKNRTTSSNHFTTRISAKSKNTKESNGHGTGEAMEIDNDDIDDSTQQQQQQETFDSSMDRDSRDTQQYSSSNHNNGGQPGDNSASRGLVINTDEQLYRKNSTTANSQQSFKNNNNNNNNNSTKAPSVSTTSNGSAFLLANNNNNTATTTDANSSSNNNNNNNANPDPVMRGTFFYEEKEKDGEPVRRHIIRGNWNYEAGNLMPPQRFELHRTLAPSEPLDQLPADGEFSGSFSLAYLHTTSKGKQKERSKVISESGVVIQFTPLANDQREYKVTGTGHNQFGTFHISGMAKPSHHDGDQVMDIEFRKSYEPPPTADNLTATATAPAAAAAAPTTPVAGKNAKLSANKSNGAASTLPASAPLPDPSPSFPSGVYCLRGRLFKDASPDLGLSEVVHKISGMWASGLDIILADPENSEGKLSQFEYEHKSMVPSADFPVSGRYSGWFDWKNDDGSATRIVERDVTLKFRKNNAGYHNVEGKGSNGFGKYTISGTLTLDHVITIFRHFVPRKVKTAPALAAAAAAAVPSSNKNVTLAPPPINAPQAKRASSVTSTTSMAEHPVVLVNNKEPKLKMDDVVTPEPEPGKSTLEPIRPPQNTTYSAASQGVLRVNEDGSHSCQGKWALARENFTNDGHTMQFNVRLEAHDAANAAKMMGRDPATLPFPLDSAMYRGSFALKKPGGSRVKPDIIQDEQVVMKFRMNSQGYYNVYGKGFNAIGTFELFGTLVVIGKTSTSGRIELYRTYPEDLLSRAPATAPGAPPVVSSSKPDVEPIIAAAAAAAAAAPVITASTIEIPAPASTGEGSGDPKSPTVPKPGAATLPRPGGIQRRESARQVKLPSKLEDDDPQAQLTRVMDKCSQILKVIREKDVQLGAFFSEPVDPVALGIPTYYQIIKEPMDLKTITKKMEENEIDKPEEFARLVRLVFENAIKFNIDPAHSVHRAARELLVLFNRKFADIERHVQKIRKDHGIGDAGDNKGKKGSDAKGARKKEAEKPKSLKEQRLAEAQTMAIENAKAVAAIVAAASPTSPTVSRAEFALLLRLIETMQQQLVSTFTLLANLSPGDEDASVAPSISIGAPSVVPVPTPVVPTEIASAPPAPEPKKKPVKRKSDVLKETPAPIIEDCTPLTIEEQTLLTDTINDLDPEHLGGVIQIIREAAPVGADEDEIDLEIDQLDDKTQRKLLQHVSKFVKKKTQPIKKKPKTSVAPQSGSGRRSKTPPATQKSKTTQAPAPAPASSSAPKPSKTAGTDSIFQIFGIKDDSDSDSDEEGEVSSQPQNNVKAAPQGGKVFTLNNDDKEDDDDDDDEGGFNGGFGATTNWNISKPTTENSKKDGDNDDAWGAAREAAAAGKVREAERKAREKKIEIEAEKARDQRLADAAARGEEIRAQRAEEEAKEAALREQQELEAEEARKAAREAARAQVLSVEQTVDLDAQRDIMKQYEQNYSTADYGSASPSSDFGF